MGVLAWGDLDQEFMTNFQNSCCKVEFVFQTLQQVVVDAMKDGVLDSQLPIMTRSFEEMGLGFLLYCEAKKLSFIGFPFGYKFFTYMVLWGQMLLTPPVIAIHCQGYVSSF